MKELDRSELMALCGGYTKMPKWVKGGFWFGVLCVVIDHWEEIKAGIADGWSDAQNNK